MITVNVQLYTILRHRPDGQTRGRLLLELRDGATVADVLRELDVPDDLPIVIAVNDELADPSVVLRDSDSIELSPAVAGGSTTPAGPLEVAQTLDYRSLVPLPAPLASLTSLSLQHDLHAGKLLARMQLTLVWLPLKGHCIVSSSSRVEEIWDTAERLFSQHGYHATTMRHIASELGLEGGSLYAHIESKEEILRAVIGRAGDQFVQTLEPIATSDAPPEEKLRMAIRDHVRLIADNLDAATVYFHEWKFLRPKYRASALERRDEYERMFRRIITDGIEAGIFRDIDQKLAGILILSVGNWLYQWYDPAGRLSPEEVADRFTDMILEGLLV